jgi:hypothetical protein
MRRTPTSNLLLSGPFRPEPLRKVDAMSTNTKKKIETRLAAIQVAVSEELHLALEALRLERRATKGGAPTLRSLMLEGLALLFRSEGKQMPAAGKSKGGAADGKEEVR